MEVKATNQVAVLGVINPASQGAGSVSTGWVSAALWYSLMAIIQVGAMTATGTLDAKLEQATDGSGTSAKDVTGSAITQLTAAGSDSNKQVVINLNTAKLDVANGFTHVRLTLTVATAASIVAALLLGHKARYEPPTQATTVDETVTV